MNNQIQPRKSPQTTGVRGKLFRRFWWLIIILIIGLVILGVVLKKDNKNRAEKDVDGGPKVEESNVDKKKSDKNDFKSTGETKPFTASQLTAANQALSTGIKIDDPENDWVKFPEGSMQPDGRPDNSNPYPLPWTDFKSLNVGADEEYLYVKFEFWGNFPEKPVIYNGDTIEGGCGKINGFTFTNSEGKKDSGDLISTINFNVADNGKIQGVDQVAMISPSGQDEHQETIFKIFSKDGMMAGGAGADYLLSAYPLSQFNLKLGDEVTFDSSGENGSTIYHHEAVDIILGHETGKFGDTIKYKLGANTYEVTPTVDAKNHS